MNIEFYSLLFINNLADKRSTTTKERAMRAVLFSVLSLFLLAAPGRSAEPPALVGNWVMHLYIGEQLFDDLVEVTVGTEGDLGGTLVVPDRFTAEIRDVVFYANQFQFEITADEGRGPFKVRYEGTMHPDRNTFVGFATVLGETPTLLGGFVGQRK
jgi:hypothetical protein